MESFFSRLESAIVIDGTKYSHSEAKSFMEERWAELDELQEAIDEMCYCQASKDPMETYHAMLEQ